MRQDTIFAPATALGRSALSIVRISGPKSMDVLIDLTGDVLPPRQLSLRLLHDSQNGEVLDKAMVVAFPKPISATGEDLVELHLHGGSAVLSAVCNYLSSMPGLRIAYPGEFTRRAFLNDRIDLTSAEGILDLIDAETDKQRRQAIAQATGNLELALKSWRDKLLSAMAKIEAFIDFPDDGLPDTIQQEIKNNLISLRAEMNLALEDASHAERIREGVQIAIVGAPNAGKSSLLNWLAKRDVAIVSSIPGTTRDILEVYLDIDGYAVTLADTAGLREATDVIEAEGVRRTLARLENADITLILSDASEGEMGRTAVNHYLSQQTTLALATKIDLIDDIPPPAPWIGISIKTGAGTKVFIQMLSTIIADCMERTGSITLTRARHINGVRVACDGLQRVLEAFDGSEPLEVVAEDLRLSTCSLERILGVVDVENILDQIFEEFCIGK
ncbi:tRNA modification GTPase TrmE [Candidatus Endolissoclinum faulkneri L2]|uniref:tRNA modification GTPase MnmE n=1 Tax=Candidatus Endolissoclinum faulkneri L2 TaxID=1193729 RepID=K7ZDP0_9PROT|nr:tRNA uridine-5-carboxymethylaminomethyl(34) synthesis GTPase MnmE [Candidatus Endolissoclinum faulkneri]AFX99701.1 tRNA modification GTPase TrmE [Candidatus Endolissoclinum faulkneri L2]